MVVPEEQLDVRVNMAGLDLVSSLSLGNGGIQL